MERGMTQQYDTEYLTQAVKEEIEVARLDLRVRGVKPTGVHFDVNVYQSKPPGSGFGMAMAPILPKWRREPRAAGALAIKHALSIRHDHEEHSVTVGYGAGRRGVTEHYGAHPNRDAAIMAAIVRAAIKKLTEERDERAALNPTRPTSSRRRVASAKSKE